MDAAKAQLAAGKALLDSQKADLAQLNQVLGAAKVDLAVAKGDLTATQAFLARVEANKYIVTTAVADGVTETADQATATSQSAQKLGVTATTSVNNAAKTVTKPAAKPVAAQAAALPQTDEQSDAGLTVLGLLAASVSFFGFSKRRKHA